MIPGFSDTSDETMTSLFVDVKPEFTNSMWKEFAAEKNKFPLDASNEMGHNSFLQK